MTLFSWSGLTTINEQWLSGGGLSYPEVIVIISRLDLECCYIHRERSIALPPRLQYVNSYGFDYQIPAWANFGVVDNVIDDWIGLFYHNELHARRACDMLNRGHASKRVIYVSRAVNQASIDLSVR